MFGFGFALVPIYQKICETAGIIRSAAPGRGAQHAGRRAAALLTIEFDANTRGLPWEFRPLQKSVHSTPRAKWFRSLYEVRNTSGCRQCWARPSRATARRRPAPYVKKIECFCFTRQALKGNETRQMPVQFVVDPGAAGAT